MEESFEGYKVHCKSLFQNNNCKEIVTAAINTKTVPVISFMSAHDNNPNNIDSSLK